MNAERDLVGGEPVEGDAVVDCWCDGSGDAMSNYGFRHWWCITCDREICGGGDSHKDLGHRVRSLTEAEATGAGELGGAKSDDRPFEGDDPSGY